MSDITFVDVILFLVSAGFTMTAIDKASAYLNRPRPVSPSIASRVPVAALPETEIHVYCPMCSTVNKVKAGKAKDSPKCGKCGMYLPEIQIKK